MTSARNIECQGVIMARMKPHPINSLILISFIATTTVLISLGIFWFVRFHPTSSNKFLRMEAKSLDQNIGDFLDPNIVSSNVATRTRTPDVPPSASFELNTSSQWENSSTSKTRIFSNSEYEIDFVETRADSVNPCEKNNWSDKCTQPLELKFLVGTNLNAAKQTKWLMPFSVGLLPDVVEQIGDYVVLIQTGGLLELPRITQIHLSSGRLIYSRLLLNDILSLAAPGYPGEQATVAIAKAIPFLRGQYVVIIHLNDMRTATQSIVAKVAIQGIKTPEIEWSKKLSFGVSNVSFVDEKLIQLDDAYESLEGKFVPPSNKTILNAQGQAPSIPELPRSSN